MSRQDSKSRKVRKRRTTATVGGTTQSSFANRSMSEILKQKPGRKPDSGDQKGEDEDRAGE